MKRHGPLIGFTAVCTNKRKTGYVTIQRLGNEDGRPLFWVYVEVGAPIHVSLPDPISGPVVFRRRGVRVTPHYAEAG